MVLTSPITCSQVAGGLYPAAWHYHLQILIRFLMFAR